jgi:hypothetical protein
MLCGHAHEPSCGSRDEQRFGVCNGSVVRRYHQLDAFNLPRRFHFADSANQLCGELPVI